MVLVEEDGGTADLHPQLLGALWGGGEDGWISWIYYFLIGLDLFHDHPLSKSNSLNRFVEINSWNLYEGLNSVEKDR